MSGIYHAFVKSSPNTHLYINTFNSAESYQWTEKGFIDLAFIADIQYSNKVKTIPAFKEPMVFVCSHLSEYPETVDPSILDIRKSVNIKWMPEYEAWYHYWFANQNQSLIDLDQLALLEAFLEGRDNWSVVPATVADYLTKNPDITTRNITNGPVDRMIYYLTGMEVKEKPFLIFMEILKKHLCEFPSIISLL